MKPTVLVLMSTYNGEKYLNKQIDSILSQIGVDVYLLIRDDGSSDHTIDIIEKYKESYSNVDCVIGNNIGFIKSFSELINMTVDYHLKPDFYAFSDQDDYWRPEKLKIACTALKGKCKEVPQLFTSNSLKVDFNDGPIELFHISYPLYRKGNVLIYNTEQGCSMVFNSKAVEIYRQSNPQLAYHDRWMCLICAFLGSIHYEHRPLFHYRIHSGNALGKIITRSQENIVKRFFSDSMTKPLNNNQEIAREFLNQFQDMLSKKDCQLISRYLDYRTSPLSKLWILFSSAYSCPERNLKSRFYYAVCTIFNKI